MQLLIRTQALTVMDSPHFTFNHFTSTRFFFFFLRSSRATSAEKGKKEREEQLEDEGEGKILRRANEKLPRTDLLIRDGLPDLYFSVKLWPRFSFKKIIRVKLDYIYIYVHSWLQKFVDGKCREIRKEIGSIFPFRAEEFRKIVKLPETNFTRNFFFLSTEKIFIRRLSSVSIFLFNERENDNRSRVA